MKNKKLEMLVNSLVSDFSEAKALELVKVVGPEKGNVLVAYAAIWNARLAEEGPRVTLHQASGACPVLPIRLRVGEEDINRAAQLIIG